MPQYRRSRPGHGTVQLSKKAAPLLGTINGKPQVHQLPKFKSPRSLNASPVSSDAEEVVENEQACSGAVVDRVVEQNRFVVFSSPPQGRGSEAANKQWRNVGRSPDSSHQRDSNHRPNKKTCLRGTKQISGISNKNTDLRGKRKREGDSSPVRQIGAGVLLKEDDAALFDASALSQRSNRQRKYGTTSNIHAAPVLNGSKKDSERSFGTATDHNVFRQPTERSSKVQKRDEPAFKLPRGLDENATNKRTKFKRPSDPADIPNETTPNRTAFQSSSTSNSSSKAPSFNWCSDDSSTSSLSSPPSSIDLNDSDEHHSFQSSKLLPPYNVQPASPASTTAVCPICDAPVDLYFLETFCHGRKKMATKEQLAFCTAHKQNAANSVWTSRNYPTIDWLNFDSRLAKYHADLEAIFDLRIESTYRKELERQVATGENRNDLRNYHAPGEHNQVPGYYGLRGKSRMLEHIMHAFGVKIKVLAVTDGVMASMGPSGYVQAVLVPELAVRLIMEDMDVNEEKAREILKESAEVGGLVNMEEEERVIVKEEDGQTSAIEENGIQEKQENSDWHEDDDGVVVLD